MAHNESVVTELLILGLLHFCFVVFCDSEADQCPTDSVVLHCGEEGCSVDC